MRHRLAEVEQRLKRSVPSMGKDFALPKEMRGIRYGEDAAAAEDSKQSMPAATTRHLGAMKNLVAQLQEEEVLLQQMWFDNS